MGTNEDAPDLEVFNFVGPLCLKMLFEAELEVYQNSFLVLSNDKFGRVITECLLKNGATVEHRGLECFDLNRFKIDRLDAIIVADYTYEKTIIGSDGIIPPENVKMTFPEAKIIQFAGRVNITELKEQNICSFPDYSVGPFKMGRTFGDLGIKPTIDLHAAGLKVGEIMVKGYKGKKKNETRNNQLSKYDICKET
jgi:hypothetical protein